MRSVVFTTFHYAGGGARGYVVNVIDEHTGFVEGVSAIGRCLGSALAGVYHGFSGQWAAVAGDVKGLYENVTKGGDELAAITSNTVQQKGGKVSKIGIVFKAFSEDEIKHTAFGKATPIAGVRKLGDDRYFKRGEVYFYQCGFELDLNAAPAGEYVFAFGACDDGWWADIAVASTYSVFLNPDREPDNRSVWRPANPTREDVKALQEEFVRRLEGHQRTEPKREVERTRQIVLPTAYEVVDIEGP